MMIFIPMRDGRAVCKEVYDTMTCVCSVVKLYVLVGQLNQAYMLD
jgi:hypothetical protein